MKKFKKKIKEGKANEVKNLLEGNRNLPLIYYKDKQGNTLLHCVCIEGRREIFEFLLSYSFQKIKNFDINQKFENIEQEPIVTLLLLAFMHNQAEIADVLVAKGAKLAISDEKKPEVLLYAIKKGYLECVKSLLPSFHKSIENLYKKEMATCGFVTILSSENSPIASAFYNEKEEILCHFFSKENIFRSKYELKKLEYSCLEYTLLLGKITLTKGLLNDKYSNNGDDKFIGISKWKEIFDFKDIFPPAMYLDKRDRRCLHAAVLVQNIWLALAAMKYCHCDPDETDTFGISPLLLAFAKKDTRMIKNAFSGSQ